MQAESEKQEMARVVAEPTALAKLVPSGTLREFAGVWTAAHFAALSQELAALTERCGVYDLGWSTRLRITGPDRVRWLNGMVTNTVKDLRPGQLNYTFLLNAQGRIQGDGEVYALTGELLFVTDCEQAPKIAAHLDRFIIMDEVELALDHSMTAIGLAGPDAEALLIRAGMIIERLDDSRFTQGNGVLVSRDDAGHFALWVESATVSALWETLIAAGAVRCGVNAVEALRVLRGMPRYGADIHDKSLAQETGQTRALNFNKGCYLGQEIVERIRSRATVHRGLYCFALEGAVPSSGTAVFAENAPDVAVGTLTSITAVDGPELPPELSGLFALGTVRGDATSTPLRYEGGLARVLAEPPIH
jgi:folate-binding protein YgfZ